MKNKSLSRRKFLAGSAAVGATMLTGTRPASAQEKRMKKTFTILHTNDMHSNFIGMGPVSDYTPLTVNDDRTRAGWKSPRPLKVQQIIEPDQSRRERRR